MPRQPPARMPAAALYDYLDNLSSGRLWPLMNTLIWEGRQLCILTEDLAHYRDAKPHTLLGFDPDNPSDTGSAAFFRDPVTGRQVLPRTGDRQAREYYRRDRYVPQALSCVPGALAWRPLPPRSGVLGDGLGGPARKYYHLQAGPLVHRLLNGGWTSRPLLVFYGRPTARYRKVLSEPGSIRNLISAFGRPAVVSRPKWPAVMDWLYRLRGLRPGRFKAAAAARFSTAVDQWLRVTDRNGYNPLEKSIALAPFVLSVELAAGNQPGLVRAYAALTDQPRPKSSSGHREHDAGLDRTPIPLRKLAHLAVWPLADAAADPAGFLKTAELCGIVG